MDSQFLIVLGAAFLLIGVILIPAEWQIYRVRKEENSHLYADRDHSWSYHWLNQLLMIGFSFLVMYILINDTDLINALWEALPLK